MVDIDFGDMSKLNVIAYLRKRNQNDMAEYVSEGIGGTAARAVADLLSGKNVTADPETHQVAEKLQVWADNRLSRAETISPRHSRRESGLNLT